MPKMNLNLGNSIYQQRPTGDYTGLTVNDGMLINQRPTAETGIQRLCDMKKAAKREEKISMQADAIMRAEMRKGMNSFLGC